MYLDIIQEVMVIFLATLFQLASDALCSLIYVGSKSDLERRILTVFSHVAHLCAYNEKHDLPFLRCNNQN